jgi:hypothetical protein
MNNRTNPTEMNNRDKPASPCVLTVTYMDKDSVKEFSGLSKREMIAAMCLQGLLANPIIDPRFDHAGLTEKSVIYADTILNQLEKQ